MVRTRFAPSPTGYLHMGSLRTIIFGYLIAKTENKNGKFILRIEDTDQKRKVDGSIEKIIEIIEWLGIKFDEGPHVGGEFGPYIQTERLEIYNKYINELLEKGEAYYCFCTAERLEKMRAEQQAQKMPPRYDRCCRELSKEEVAKRIKNGEKYVIRQKMPIEGNIIIKDELRGDISFNAKELEDHVLIKSDGIPTYHFANVVDDHLMQISHVLRGEEWIPSFPKNILLYKSFSWKPPKFIHMTLSLNKGGGKLSKRQGDVSVEDYKKNGYLPEALINFSALMGWHPKGDNEIYTLEEMTKEFNYRDMGISAAVFDIEKLDYLNGYYIRRKSIEEMTDLCLPYLEENLKLTNSDYKKEKVYIQKVIKTSQERLKKLSEIGELTDFFFQDELQIPPEMLVWKKMNLDDAKKNLIALTVALDKIDKDNWNEKNLESTIVEYLKNNDLKIGEYLWPMRVALTGKQASPSPFEVADVLGKKETIKRIQKASS